MIFIGEHSHRDREGSQHDQLDLHPACDSQRTLHQVPGAQPGHQLRQSEQLVPEGIGCLCDGDVRLQLSQSHHDL